MQLFEDLVEPGLVQPTFVCDYPAVAQPLARPHRSEPGLIEAWDLIIGGVERGTGFSELVDPVIQREVLTAQSLAAAAGDPEAFPHAGEPWQPLKIYYNATFSKARILAFHNALLAAGQESPYAEWLERWEAPDRPVTTRVECGEYFEVRDRALLAHATQIDPDGSWFRVPRETQTQIWPTEDFECGLSYVPLTTPSGAAPDGPNGEVEDSLFGGLGTVAEADALARSGELRIAHDGRKESTVPWPW